MAKLHSFRSFKERINALKIDPVVKLGVRSHDDTSTSFYLTTLTHWKDINISGNFTSCCENLEAYSRSLPQVIYHKKLIFETLELYISKHDIHSLQPLLETLTQLIHDLGPEFLPFYRRYVRLMIDVCSSVSPNDSQSMKNSAYILEWCFNSLAFAFRYLSTELSKNLWESFEELIPLLKDQKKAYVGRFCAEAMSYLLKKLSKEAYLVFVDECFSLISETDPHIEFLENMATLFAEAMKVAKDSLHSKLILLLKPVLRNAIHSSRKSICVLHVASRIIMEVLHHASIDTSRHIGPKLLEELNTYLDKITTPKQVYCLLFLYLAVIFIDNGRKIHWDHSFALAIKAIISKFVSLDERDAHFPECSIMFSLLWTLLIRNLDVSFAALLFQHSWDVLTSSHSVLKLSILDILKDIKPESFAALGFDKKLQQIIKGIDLTSGLQRLSLIIAKSGDHDFRRLESLALPDVLKDQLIDSILVDIENGAFSVAEINWKCEVLKLKLHLNANDQKKLFEAIILISQQWNSLDSTKVYGQLISLFLKCPDSATTSISMDDLCDIVKNNIMSCGHSELVINAAKTLFVSCRDKDRFSSNLIRTCVKNLSSPRRSLRIASLDALHSLSPEYDSFFSEMEVIDQMPLEVQNANAMKLKILALFRHYSKQPKTSLLHEAMSHYIAGLLYNRYQPCWDAVFEGLKDISDSNFDRSLSALIHEKILADTSSIPVESIQRDSFHDDPDIWLLRRDDGIFKAVFKKVSDHVPISHQQLQFWINEIAKVDLDFKVGQVRGRMVKCLREVPRLASVDANRTFNLIQTMFKADGDTNWSNDEKCACLDLVSSVKTRMSKGQRNELTHILNGALGSKHVKLQEAALRAFFTLDSSFGRYCDALLNLLDDKLFKEELLKLLGESSSDRVRDEDEELLIPLILQILFGKIQSSSKKSLKLGAKFTIASILPNLSQKYLIQFMKHMGKKIPYEAFFTVDSSEVRIFDNVKVMSGFVNMLIEVYDALGYKFSEELAQSIEPLVYVLACTQELIDLEGDNPAAPLKALRQLSFKCLCTFDKLVGSHYNWDSIMPKLFNFVLLPRLTNFESENTQQVSSLLEFIVNRVNHQRYLEFYSLNGWTPLKAITSLLANNHSKDDVIICLLEFFISALTKQSVEQVESTDRLQFLAVIVEALLDSMPELLQNSKNREVVARCSTLLLLLVEGHYLHQDNDKQRFIRSSCKALQKSSYFVRSEDKISILLSLALMVETFTCDESLMVDLTRVISKTLRFAKDRRMRSSVTEVFGALACHQTELKKTVTILELLNVSQTQYGDHEFKRLLDGFDLINEEYFATTPSIGWTPTIASSLFHMDNEEESVIRLNASLSIKTLASVIARKGSVTEKGIFKGFFDDWINPAINHGILSDSDGVRSSYIDLLAFLAELGELLPSLSDLKTLSSEDDSENFFVNIQHIQITSRQRAVRELYKKRESLSASSARQYIIPILENYVICKDEKTRNLCDDAQKAFASTACVLSWLHFAQYLKKYIGMCSTQSDMTRDGVKMVVHLIRNLSLFYKDEARDNSSLLQGFPEQSDTFNSFVVNQVVQPIKKNLSFRDDSTIIMRLPMLEACIIALLMTPSHIIQSELPSILISACQVLRSKSQELRDNARKALHKASNHLGTDYLRYLIRELRAALSRGSQIHVLSYTLHAILREVCHTSNYGDIDDSASLIVEIVMEDIFGAAGKDKDAEDYHSKMMEVKAKKSFDTLEILSSKLSLKAFDIILDAMKTLLKERLPTKTEKAVDECFRRICSGILANDVASTTNVLILCYGIHTSARLDPHKDSTRRTVKKDEKHYIVEADRRLEAKEIDYLQSSHYLQRFSFEILRAVLGKNPKLLTVANIDGFIPLLSESMKFSNEPLTAAVMRVAVLFVTLQLPPNRDVVLDEICRKAIEIVLESPSTKSELCQLSLKYTATVLRHRREDSCSNEAIRALITKITPDLEDPEKQGLAFNFLKAVITRRIQLPEVYGVMDKILQIMVVNHFQEIRDISRGLYLKFMLLYDQGERRMENSFKFLVDNLTYPTPSGRQSVMELIHSILLRSKASIIEKYVSSFFVGFANLAVSDELSRCREMSTVLMHQLIENASVDKLKVFEKLIKNWLQNRNKDILRRCGLISYKIYVSVFGVGKSSDLDKSASELLKSFLTLAKDHTSEGHWENIYLALDVLNQFLLKTSICPLDSTETFWSLVCDSLLYPHTWVRLLSSKLVGNYISRAQTDDSVQDIKFMHLIAHRSLRQLAAPGLPERLSQESVNNVKALFTYFKEHETPYVPYHDKSEADPKGSSQYLDATDMILSRSNLLLRKCLSSDFNSTTRKAVLNVIKFITESITGDRLLRFCQEFVTSLVGVEESFLSDDVTFKEHSQSCLRIAEQQLGTQLYSKVFTAAKADVSIRRAKRKADRAQLKLENPLKASERRMKKHAKFREKRKNNKDENGFYRAKKRKI